MNRPKIYDCIIFYDENLLVNSRFEILDEVVDFFVVCESIYDHRGKNKGINFFLKSFLALKSLSPVSYATGFFE